MGWANESPISYYKPVAPELAVPNDTAAKILASGNGAALFTQAAIARERAKIDYEQMLQRADLQANQLSFERDQLSQQHDLAIRGQDIQNKNVLLDYDVANKSLELRKEVLDQTRKDKLQGLDILTDYTRQNAQYANEFRQRAIELGVDDPKLQSSDPVTFAAGIKVLSREYGLAVPSTGIPNQLKSWQTIADQQKNSIQWNGHTQQMPIHQILDLLSDPSTHDVAYQGLRDAGHITEKNVTPEDASIWDKWFHKKMEDVPDTFTKKILQQASSLHPEDIQSRIPIAAPRSEKLFKAEAGLFDPRTSKAGRLNAGAALPAPDLPDPQPTETDQAIALYKRAVIAAPEKKDQLFQMFRQLHPDIDPSAVE